MKAAIPFYKHFKYFDKDKIQLNINYKPKIKELDSFIEVYQDYRINFIMPEIITKKDFEYYKILHEKYPNTDIVFAIKETNDILQMEEVLNEFNIPHYYGNLISDYDRLHGFLELNITDIFISGDLLFDMDNVCDIIDQKNIKVRAYCNICQSTWPTTPVLKTAFIRPEDLHLYEEYIDTIEFYPLNSVAPKEEQLNILYDTYFIKKLWFGNLSEIIANFDEEIDSRGIIPDFGELRMNCKKSCYHSLNPSCHICDRIIDLQKTLIGRNLIIKN